MKNSNYMDSKEKLWCNINGCDGYMISNHGDVVSYRKTNSKVFYKMPKLLKQSVITTHCNKKYNRILILGKSYYIHRLVAMHFIDNPKNKPQVNHIDGNSQNNIVSNLEWVDNSENQIHRFTLAGRYSNLSKYIYRNRNTYKVEKRGVVNRCFKTLLEAESFATHFY